MSSVSNYYPKFLGFLQLIYPRWYEHLAINSDKSDLVEAKLLSSNCYTSFQAMVFSEGEFSDGDQFSVNPNSIIAVPYAWDWRWVFAINMLYNNQNIYSIRFKQKVIALPTGNNPLTKVFFKNLNEEFTQEIQSLIKQLEKSGDNIHAAFSKHLYFSSQN